MFFQMIYAAIFLAVMQIISVVMIIVAIRRLRDLQRFYDPHPMWVMVLLGAMQIFCLTVAIIKP